MRTIQWDIFLSASQLRHIYRHFKQTVKMAFGLCTNPWILLGAATIVILSCVPPLATGQNAGGPNNNSLTNNTGGQPAPGNGTTAGAAAAIIQSKVIADLTSKCSDVQICAKDNKVEPSNADFKDVCYKMQRFYTCTESKCSTIPNLDTLLKDGKVNYQDCSGCALQVSTIIMLLAIVVSRLV